MIMHVVSPSVCLSVCLCRSVLWLSDTSYAKVSEQVNIGSIPHSPKCGISTRIVMILSSVSPSVRLSVTCVLWVNDTSYAKVSEQLNRKCPHIPRSIASLRRQQNDKSPKLVSVNVCRRPRRRNTPQMSLWQSSISVVCISSRRPWRPLSLYTIWFLAGRVVRMRRLLGFLVWGLSPCSKFWEKRKSVT